MFFIFGGINMKEKKTIKGVKKTTQNYTGKVVNVVKKIIAVALLMGIMLTAAQAIRMFKHWYESRTNDVGVEDVQKQENVTFEDVFASVQLKLLSLSVTVVPLKPLFDWMYKITLPSGSRIAE